MVDTTVKEWFERRLLKFQIKNTDITNCRLKLNGGKVCHKYSVTNMPLQETF